MPPLQQVAEFAVSCLWLNDCGRVVNSVVYFTYVYVVCHFTLVCLFKVGCAILMFDFRCFYCGFVAYCGLVICIVVLWVLVADSLV